MDYRDFLTALLADGAVSVGPYGPLPEQDAAAGDLVLAEMERTARLEMPGNPPPFDPLAGRWAGVQFYRACQFTIYRNLDAETLAAELGRGAPQPITPATHYSVDLVMRYLPQLLKFARSAAETDPLVTQLMQWAVDWPLSSVGVAELPQIEIAGFADNPSLLQLYADRLLAHGDASRLADPRARAAVASAVGRYPEIGGKLTQLLQPDRQESIP